MVFLEVTKWPENGQLVVPMKNKVVKAYLLEGKKRLKTKTAEGGQVIYLPKTAPDPVASVVAVKIAGPVQPD
jgi:alpha-L-fucosidase